MLASRPFINERDPNFDYWASEMYGTGKSHSVWTLSGLDMSNWWRGDVWRSERETAAVILTKLREGETPHGAFDFDYHAHP